MVYRSTSASLAPRPHPPPMVTCHIYLSATHRAPPSVQKKSLPSGPGLRDPTRFSLPAGFRFTPSISSEGAKEETAEGNWWEAGEVGKWVRGLRPKRRQLPLARPGPLLASPPRCPSASESTVGEGPLGGPRVGSAFFFCFVFFFFP